MYKYTLFILVSWAIKKQFFAIKMSNQIQVFHCPNVEKNISGMQQFNVAQQLNLSRLSNGFLTVSRDWLHLEALISDNAEH